MLTLPKKVGRPQALEALMPVSVRLSDATYAQLCAIAKAAGKDVSVVIREAIDQRISDDRRRLASR